MVEKVRILVQWWVGIFDCRQVQLPDWAKKRKRTAR